MKPEEINRAIAEALDFYVIQDGSGGGWKLCHPRENVRYSWKDSEEAAWSDCDEYCSDLNAMHEAENTLHDSYAVTYGLHINTIMSRDIGGESENTKDYSDWHATAPQRAEAFLRTINKWVEEKQ